MHIDGRTIFLLDGVGAVISTLLLALALPALRPVLGMPHAFLWPLAGIAALFAAYSFTCFRLADHADPRFLRAIAVANGLYCVLTLILVGVAWSEVSALGVAYFVGEALVIGALVVFEWRLADRVARGRVSTRG